MRQASKQELRLYFVRQLITWHGYGDGAAANRPFIACPVNYGSFNANQRPSTETRSSIRSAGGDSFGFICSELDVGLPDAGGMADNKMRPSSPQPPGRHRSIGVLLFFIPDCLYC